MKQLHQKKSNPVMAEIANTISDSGVSSTEKKVKEEEYSEIVLPQLRRDDPIKMDSNPSYGSYTGQGTNIAVQPNPSYGVNKPNDKITEDYYDYARPTEITNVAIEPNPSYEVATRMGTNTKTTPGSGVIISPNPAYTSVKAKK
ncbi:uncharacterized protein [Dysidea avara]|uniref:uncharacterized protein n=1 Tax=Dysidea avara TaxID=196820 RepID=UPI00332F3681